MQPAPHCTLDAAAMPRVLLEDNHLLIVDKPHGMPTQGAAPGVASLVDWAKDYLKRKYAKPGAVYLGVVSRLDAATAGAVVFARTSKAAARLSEAFRLRKVQKTYWAFLEASPPETEGELRHWLRYDDDARRNRAAPREVVGAQEAVLRYRRLAETADGAAVEIDLLTGRKHQIRAQFSAAGRPIWGDRRYGARSEFRGGVALLARRLQLEHPVRRAPVDVTADLPASWRSFWPSLGEPSPPASA